MKIDNLSVGAIENFLKKNQIANQTQSKEIRLTTKEMNEISISLAGVMTNIIALSLENDKLKTQIQVLEGQLNLTNVNLDGGEFKDD